MGRAVKLLLFLGSADAPLAVLEARTGPGQADRQWFLFYGEAARTLRALVPEKSPLLLEASPDDAPLELLDDSKRTGPRWRCKIPAQLEQNGASAAASIIDISDSGVKLEELRVVPRAGSRCQVAVRGLPGEGLLFHGQVAWSNLAARSAGVRFMPAQREEARRVSSWVAEVQVTAMAESMPGSFLA